MAEGGEDPKKSRTPSLTSPASFVGLTNDQLMEIAEHPRAFSQFCGQHRQQQTTASSGSSKDLEPQLLTPVRSCCSFVRFSASSSDELRLKRYLMVKRESIFFLALQCSSYLLYIVVEG